MLIKSQLPRSVRHVMHTSLDLHHLNRSIKVSFGDLLTLAQNKPYVFVTLGAAVNFAFIFGFNTFGAKYVEIVFGLKPFDASLLYGSGSQLV